MERCIRFFRKRPEEVKTSERHLFINSRKGKYTVKEMCQILNVSESGYYRWLKNRHKPTKRQLLSVKIKEILEEHSDNDNYGVNRMQLALLQKGIETSKRTVYRAMKESGLLHKRRRPHGITKATTEVQEKENIIKRNFKSDKPLKKFLTDISEFQCKDGKLYISPVMDCCNGEIVALEMHDNMKKELCIATVEQLHTRFPNLKAAILHSDRGSQYTSEAFRQTLKKYGIQQSLSGTGHCFDNARMESCQFVIPVYQRNYTWSAEKEVKQYLLDLENVLNGDYRNHFLGILIYLEKSIDYSTREFSIIDGQQRLTTTFLILYAIKKLFENNGDDNNVQILEGQCLTNPYHSDKVKYKLKPLVSDDDVYRCIVENRFDEIKDKKSNVILNYDYIYNYLNSLILKGYSANSILMALDKLYVVCVPIDENDNAQKIFESINATGVKLTAADLIRNFLLMNLGSEDQDKFYSKYWKSIENNVSSDSKKLEMFFRMFLAIKKYELVPKNSVYRNFVSWVKEQSTIVLPGGYKVLNRDEIVSILTESL